MLYLYDKALEDKFKKVFKNTIYAPVDKFYERYLLNNQNGAVQLPALSLWRSTHEFFPYDAKTQVSIPNMSIRRLNSLDIRNLYSMKISLSYQLDIWASTDIDRDDLMKEILYFLVTYPNIYIEYEGQKFVFPVLVEAPEDTTEIANFESSGDLYRMTIPLQIPDARLMFYQDSKLCKYIDISYYVDDQLDSVSRIGDDERKEDQ